VRAVRLAAELGVPHAHPGLPYAPPLVRLQVDLEGLGAVKDVGQVKVDDVVAWGVGGWVGWG